MDQEVGDILLPSGEKQRSARKPSKPKRSRKNRPLMKKKGKPPMNPKKIVLEERHEDNPISEKPQHRTRSTSKKGSRKKKKCSSKKKRHPDMPDDGCTVHQLDPGGYVEWRVKQPERATIILVVSHGGHLEPNDMKERSAGSLINDTWTEDLARLIGARLDSCHLIVNHCKRKYLDTNRPCEEGTSPDDNAAKMAWRQFHSYIEQAKQLIAGRCLLLDIHGHSHTHHEVELGYLLTASDIGRLEEDPNYCAEKCSVQCDASNVKERILGSGSFGSVLMRCGVEGVYPSEVHPLPKPPFWSGGYVTMRHCDEDCDSIQLESSQNLRFKEEDREKFAAAVAQAICIYCKEKYSKT